eukprot:Platyproteum_vivax@DN4864_c0_g1_i2.p3
MDLKFNYARIRVPRIDETILYLKLCTDKLEVVGDLRLSLASTDCPKILAYPITHGPQERIVGLAYCMAEVVPVNHPNSTSFEVAIRSSQKEQKKASKKENKPARPASK